MSFTDEYLALQKKKKKKEDEQKTTGHSFTDDYLSRRETTKTENIAPVYVNKTAALYKDLAPLKKTTTKKDDDERKWFEKGAFEDGYQFGDVFKATTDTFHDVSLGILQGLGNMAEGVVDLATYGVAGVSDLVGADKFAGKAKDFAKNDLVNSGAEWIRKDNSVYDDSILGEKSQGVTQGLGQVAGLILTGGLGASAGLGAAGTTALTTGLMGASSMGGGMSEAYNAGATDGEAVAYGAIKGAVDAGSELIFGGLGKTVNALGLSRGISSLDDIFARKLSSKISNQAAKNLVQYGVKASGEGLEEVLAGLGTAAAKKLTYMSDEELSQLVKDENLLEQFVVGTVVSGIAQGGDLVLDTRAGRDFVTGMNANEETVVNKVYEDRVAEAEKNGKITEKEKSKIYDQVIADMDKGYITTDTIEEVLGGETYKTHTDTIAREKALQDEYDTLYKMKNGDKSDEQIDRQAELKKQLDNIKQNFNRNQLGDEVMSLVKGSRLAESYNERSRRGQAFQADVSKYDAKQQATIQKAIDSGILNNTNRTHEFVDMVAKITADKGVVFDFTNNENLKNSGFAVDGKTVNGYVTADGVTLNIDSAKSLNSVVGHEITHVLEGTEMYTALQSVVTEYAKTKGEYDSRLASLTKLYENVKDADVNAELTADLVGDYLFTDPDFVRNLSVTNRNVFQKIYDEIKYLYKIATAGSKEARELERVKKLFEQAYRENVSPKDAGNAKFSIENGNNRKYNKSSRYSETETLFLSWENGSAPVGEVKRFVRFGKVRYYEKTENGSVELSESQYNERRSLYVENLDGRAEREIGETADYDGSSQKGTTGYPDSNRYTGGNASVFGQTVREELQNDTGRSTSGALGYNRGNDIIQSEYSEEASDESGASFTFSNDYATVRNFMKEGDAAEEVGDATIRFSLSDSDGKQLSTEQQDFFKESKERDENGNLRVMYRGDADDIAVFDRKKSSYSNLYGRGFYFTNSKSHAGQYGKPTAYYLNVTSPVSTVEQTITKEQMRKFLEAVAENEDYGLENYGYGATVDSVLDSVYSGKSDFAMLYDVSQTAIGDMVAATELFNEINGTTYDGFILDTETVVFNSNQIKRVDNTNPTSNQDVRFSLSEPVEQTKDLMALHNLTEEKLLKSLKLGGLPMPSVAIAKAKDGHGDFGEISLVLPRDTIDPEYSQKNKLYSGDAWTPTYPNVEYKVDEKVLRNISKKLYELVPSNILHDLGRISLDADNMTNTLNRYGGDVVDAFGNNDALKYAYLLDVGSDIRLPMKEKRISYGSNENGEIIRIAEAISADEIKQAMNGASEGMWKLEPRVRQAVAEYWQSEFADDPEALEMMVPKEELPFSKLDGYLSDAMRFHRNGVEQTVDTRGAKRVIAYEINQAGYENWLKRTFNGIVEKEGIRNNKDFFTPSGNRRSFEALHYEHNLENVIKAMRETGEKGIGFGGGSIFGAATTEFSSVEEMKQASGRLRKTSDEEYQAMRDEFTNRFFEIARSLPKDKGSFMATDDAANTLSEAVSKYKTRSGIASYLKRELNGWATYSEQAVDDLIELVRDIRNMPTGYFEAKPQRAVGFDEVGVFVIPNNADVKLKQELLNRGYSIAEYDPNIEGHRQQVVNQFEEYKFSLSNVGETPDNHGLAPLNKFKYSQTYGKDIRLETADNVAPVQEATVAENTTVAEDLFPDDIAPVEQELDRLIQEQEALEARLQEMVEDGDFSTTEWDETNARWQEVVDRIAELETEATETDAARVNSLDDADVPPMQEAPYGARQDETVQDPFADRDYSDVGNRKVKAYMYENPEVKPFFQMEAEGMLGDLLHSIKGERLYNDDVYYATGGEKGWGGTRRHTTDDIAYLLDSGYTYAEIEKGLKAIIEDNGAENNAVSKRIEFALNDRLLNGYKDLDGRPIPANEEYINLLNEKQINEYSKEAFDAFMANADSYAPPADDIGPVVKPTQKAPEAYEAIKPKSAKEPRMAMATPAEQATAQVLVDEPKVDKKKPKAWNLFKDSIVDKGTVFETMSLKSGNRELQAKWKSIGRAESSAQWFMEHGNAETSSLKSIRETVEQSGKTQQFYEYLYHLHNVDRMNLENRYADMENKPVFGYTVTSDISKETAAKLEQANPEFKQWAESVYSYMNTLREMLVDNGVISGETAKLWAEMYPHYVPVRRMGDDGVNINVALDTKRTGINAPVKRATGGNQNILPLFDTMALRTEQTFKAIAKNRFGVELKNMLGTTIDTGAVAVDDAIDSVEGELLQEGKDGKNPTFTVFEDGERVTFEITEEMYDTMKPKSKFNSYTNKVLNTANNIRRGLLTEYNPAFMLTNPIKDTQDVLINSQHPARTYANYPKAIAELIGKKGQYYQEYMENGGEQNTYFDGETKTFAKEKSGLAKVIGFPLEKISQANNFIERIPRMAEYIASRKMGRSIDVSMLDAARVTTDFSAGGDFVRTLNRNGFTFLNASVQGAVQQVRNVREAKYQGAKGWVKLAAKVAAAGLPAMLLNHLLWDDDEDYEELSDYVKQNYYVVAKYGDGKFVRIPKGRALAVIQNGFEQMKNLITGDDEADLDAFAELVISNLAPNNPLENNLIAPIVQAKNNTTWYGDDLVPTRLQDVPAAEQFDETTDSLSKWLGEKLNISPYKINYVLDQYSGALGDTFLPMLTPEAERGNDNLWGDLIAPISDKFTTDSVLKNQNISDFYDKADELTVNANASGATDEDVLMSKYMSSVNSELAKLYAQKRKVQNSGMKDAAKYEEVRNIQKQIEALTKKALGSYSDISFENDYREGGEYARVADRLYKLTEDGEWAKLSDEQVTKYEVTKAAGDASYATDGTNHYRWYVPGEDAGDDAEPGWRKVTDKELERQNEVTDGLGISPEEYWNKKEEYSYAYDYPENYAVAKAVGGYEAYRGYSGELYDIKADKDKYGKSITGSRKEKVLNYINNLDADYYTKIILWKSEYPSDDSYNNEIIEYLNGRNDISFAETIAILRKLGFDVTDDGNISW